MDPTRIPEILSTTAEVSVAFVGFAALIAVFRGSQGLRGELRTMSLIETGLLTLVFSLLPHVFAHFELAREQIWRFSSSLLAAALAIELLRIRAQNRRLVALGAPIQSSALLWIVAAGIAFVAVAQVSNAIGWPWPPRFSVYFLGIFWMLVSASLIFGLSFWIGYGGRSGDAT